MDISRLSAAAGIENAASLTEGVIKDTTGAQLITKTLDELNTYNTITGPKINHDYQTRKDLLNAEGIGKALDAIA